MYQPTGFKDSENIIIINKIPYFRYTGSTYKDKLKNGLSLEYVFQQEDMIPNMDEESNVEIEENRSIQNLEAIDYEENYEFYEQKEFEAISLARKGKWMPFKNRQARNTKKKNIKSKSFLLLNGDALFNFNLENIFDKHFRNNRNITFISSETQLPYGTIGVIGNKVRSFEREAVFNAIIKKNIRNFRGYLYSGMSIINSNLLKLNFKNFENFEKEFYPLIIKRGKADLKILNGFWHSIDNVKDIQILNNHKKKNEIQKLIKIIKKNEK